MKKLIVFVLFYHSVFSQDQKAIVDKSYELEEVKVNNKVKEKTLEIGLTNDNYLQAFENNNLIEIKYFPFKTAYEKTPYLKNITIQTENKLEKTKVKLHFYEVNEKGLPGKEMLDRDCFVNVKDGNRKTTFSITHLNLEFPKNGLFVAFEKLNLTENQIVKTNPNNKVSKTLICPNIFFNQVENSKQIYWQNNNWQIKQNNDNSTFYFNEPAIYLTLSN